MRIIDDRRGASYQTILGVTFTVVLWSVIHDQYLVRISPEHFTEYHEPLWQVENPVLLALLYAIGASIGPGLLLGIATTFIGRNGSVNRVRPRTLIIGSIFVVVATEIVSACAGLFVFLSEDVFYPTSWFPDLTVPIQITQTIQVTAYIGASVFSAAFLIFIFFKRRRKGKAQPKDS